MCALLSQMCFVRAQAESLAHAGIVVAAVVAAPDVGSIAPAVVDTVEEAAL